jgi:hypothetical protein
LEIKIVVVLPPAINAGTGSKTAPIRESAAMLFRGFGLLEKGGVNF